MPWLALLIGFSFAAFGFCYIVGGSRISFPVRTAVANHGSIAGGWLLELIECPACLGAWVGGFVGIGVSYHFGLTAGESFIVALGLACYTAGVNYILGRLTGLIDKP